MASTVYQKNTKTGVVYAYESVAFWDKEKRCSRAKRKCLGRVDPETKLIIPTRKRGAARGTDTTQIKPGPVPFARMSRSFYGATYLFDRIGEATGVAEDLKRCFPDVYRQILSIAYYLIMEDRSPLGRFPRWASVHHHPHGDVIASQRSSELFASISEDARQRFFKLQAERRVEQEYLAYDSTSISSYSKTLQQVRYGKNKDHEHLPQLNLVLLFGQQSRLPLYYRKLAGNIPDVKTLKKLLSDMNTLGYEKLKVVLDRGFFSAANINDLYKNHTKFLIASKTSLKLIKPHLDDVRDTLRNWKHFIPSHQLYGCCLPISWDYTANPNSDTPTQETRRMYLHLYHSPERALEDEKEFNNQMTNWQEELENDRRHPDHESYYERYFEVKTTPIRGTKVTAKEEAIAQTKQNYGYFSLLSNEVKDPVEALEIYRNKDVVEKAFDNLKDRLGLRRTAVSSEQSLDGKLFVQFIALIYLSHLTKKMQETELFKHYTLQEVLDELDLIECFDIPGQKRHIGEITKRQSDLYDKLGFNPPSSLQ